MGDIVVSQSTFANGVGLLVTAGSTLVGYGTVGTHNCTSGGFVEQGSTFAYVDYFSSKNSIEGIRSTAQSILSTTAGVTYINGCAARSIQVLDQSRFRSVRIFAIANAAGASVNIGGASDLAAGETVINFARASTATDFPAAVRGGSSFLVTSLDTDGYTTTDLNVIFSLFTTDVATLTTAGFFQYNVFSSAVSYERSRAFWDSGTFRLQTEVGSSGGTARALALGTNGTARLTLNASGTVTLDTVANLPTSEPAAGAAGTVWLQNDGGSSNSAFLMVTTS
jgi:hypothetical protein